MIASPRLRPQPRCLAHQRTARTTFRYEGDWSEASLDFAIRRLSCSLFRVDPAQLDGPRRSADLVRARAFVTWALRSLKRQRSYPEIGRLLGNRHHTTIMNLHEKAIRLRLTDPQFKAACDRFERVLNEGKEA